MSVVIYLPSGRRQRPMTDSERVAVTDAIERWIRQYTGALATRDWDAAADCSAAARVLSVALSSDHAQRTVAA